MTKFKGDKRTKAYKNWKENHAKESQGLGDTIEKITTATGIKKAVKFLAGEDCGCDERKNKLNEIFRYEKPECLNEDEFNYLADTFSSRKTTIKSEEQNEMLKIYNRVFKQNAQPTSCSPCFVSGVYKKLETIYNKYISE